jgi:hypothetical protein
VEVNQHGINNANGTGHISGVYQWLNKKYEDFAFVSHTWLTTLQVRSPSLQLWPPHDVVRYGPFHSFFPTCLIPLHPSEFMIPEPAAFLTHVLSTTANGLEANLLLEKPTPFDKTPDEIGVESVGTLIAKYQATDVLPPPEDYITVSDQAKFGGGDSNTNYDHGAILSIPSGYQAVYATVSVVKNIWTEKRVTMDLMVGGETTRLSPAETMWGTSIINHLDNQSMATGGSIAWAFNTLNVPDGVVSVEVLCRVTERRKQQWQAETHAKLIMAYKARMAEYEEKLSRLKLDTGIAIQGTCVIVSPSYPVYC